MTLNEKLNALTVMSSIQAIIRVDGSFATLAMLVDDADLDAVVNHFNKAVTDKPPSSAGEQAGGV